MKKKRVVTIHVNAEDPAGQMIRASVRGLDREGRDAVIERMHSEGLKLLRERMWRRRFRAPVEVHFLGKQSGAHSLIGLLQAVDVRGRKAGVKLKISGLATKRRKNGDPASPNSRDPVLDGPSAGSRRAFGTKSLEKTRS
jgi:hypothetical protein